jgi:PAS domain S-box-containing protein
MDGTIERINRRAIETFGYLPEDIPDMAHWWRVAYPDESYRNEVVAEWTSLVMKAIAEKTEIGRREYRATCKDGTVKTMLIFGIPVADKVFVMFDDITDRKRAEEERLALERQLLQAQKMESLGVLAGGIAHDFNNILTSIVGNTELALLRLDPDSPARDNIERIEKSAVHASDLARQMLAYSGKGRFVVEPVDINRLVEEMGHMFEVSVSKKAALRFDLSGPLPAVEGDATQIRQVLLNLVINASEAIGDRSGVIAVSTGCRRIERDGRNAADSDGKLPEGDYVFLEVEDTGCGMDRETRARIFDPFFTTKFTGRGLGMAVVQGIVRGHKGAILVLSEPGKGSRFTVLLPAGPRPAERAEPVAGRERFKGEGTILLVDDEEDVRAVGTEMLAELGFTVVTADDGREAVERFRATPGLRCVILDMTMPRMDGEETFRELKALDPELKVILSSGYSEDEVTQKFAGKGLAGFIRKPYTLSLLREVLEKC